MKHPKNNIILIGMMLSGKTTIGRILSEKKGFKFVDLDLLIEKNEKMKISEIFSKKGEPYFRNLETKTLKTLLNETNIVLSTGGGTPKNEENFKILNSLGIIFYLELMPDEIFERIKDDKTRPLLQNENPKSVLEKLYAERKKYYEKADFKINANKKIDEITNEIIKNYETTES